MGSTAKIVYSSILTILIISLFLIFYMQKSAQLALDKQDIQQTVEKKEQLISEIQQTLKETTLSAENARKKNDLIPELSNTITAIEKEKALYQQQVKDLHEQLNKQLDDASKRMVEFTTLQKQFDEQQKQLASAEKEKVALEAEIHEITRHLKTSQNSLEHKDARLKMLAAALKEKDEAIALYKEQLEASTETIRHSRSANNTKAMNLSLVLDELARKTQQVVDLQEQLEQLSGTTGQPGASATTQRPTDAALAEISALIEKMNQQPTPAEDGRLAAAITKIQELELSNTTLQSQINEQSAHLQDLLNDLQVSENSNAENQEKLLLLQTDNQFLSDELNKLHHMKEEAGQTLTELQILLTDKDQEIENIIIQNQEVTAQLTENLSSLEQQLKEASEQNALLTENSTHSETTLAELQAVNDSLSKELEPAKSALGEVQLALSQAREEIETLSTQQTDTDKQHAQQVESLQSLLDQQTAATETAVKHSTDLQKEIDQISSTLAEKDATIQQLTSQITANDGAEKEQKIAQLVADLTAAKALSDSQIKEHTALVSQKDATIQNLTDQLSTNNEQLASLQTALDEAKAQQSNETDTSTVQQQEIERLTEEAATAKAAADEQTALIESIKEQVTALKDANKELEDSLNANQENLTKSLAEVTTLQTSLSALTAERDKLKLMTTDSDNDGISDAEDACPDTIKGAKVDEQGCEKDSDGDGLVDRLDLCPGSNSGAAIDNAGCTEEQTTVVLEGISFQFGTAELTEDAHHALDTAAAILQNNSDLQMEIAGHTDSIGEEESNLQLSTLRAQSVLNYLVSKGVSADSLQAKGYGAAEPIADNTTDTGRSKNRRVELRKIQTATPQETEKAVSPETVE